MMHQIGSYPYLTNGISTLNQLENVFMDKWGEKKDNRYLLVALSSTKKNENETMEEFNKRFSQIVQKLNQNIKPLEQTILIYYLDSFDGEMDFHLRQQDPQNLATTQQVAIKVEKT
jgi:hypothetical protein